MNLFLINWRAGRPYFKCPQSWYPAAKYSKIAMDNTADEKYTYIYSTYRFQEFPVSASLGTKNPVPPKNQR